MVLIGRSWVWIAVGAGRGFRDSNDRAPGGRAPGRFGLDRWIDCVTVDDRGPTRRGKAIVGFGHQTLRFDSGRMLDWMVIGFSPRKASTTIYLSGSMDTFADLLVRLGKHTTGGGCLSLKRLDDVDPAVLAELLARSVAYARTPDG